MNTFSTAVPYAKSVSIIEDNKVTKLQISGHDTWSVNYLPQSDYLIEVDEQFLLPDPANPNWVVIEHDKIVSRCPWSNRKPKFKFHESGLSLEISSECLPCQITDRFNNANDAIIHFLNLKEVTTDLMVIFFWVHSSANILAHVDSFVVKRTPNTNRFIYSWIEIHDNIPPGDWVVYAYVNGMLVSSNQFTFIRFLTYKNRVYK